MSKLSIVIYPDPKLREKAEPVVEVDDSVRTLIADMFETMREAPGIGLAANQVGVLKRVIVIDIRSSDPGFVPLALVNPEIKSREGDYAIEEGCLSLPDFNEVVDRARKVVVTYTEPESGESRTIEAEELLAVVLQHEIDHLDGKLIVDYVSRLKRSVYTKKMKKLKKEKSLQVPTSGERVERESDSDGVTTTPVNIVFLGTPEFALPALRTLHKAEDVSICAVVTPPDRPAGRGQKPAAPPIAKEALAQELELIQSPSLAGADLHARILERKPRPDALVVVALGQMVPDVLLMATPLGTLNLHPSLLPKYRGASPIQSAILAGENETGVSTMFLTKELDAGAVILQRRTAIGENETAGELHDRLATLGAELLLETLRGLRDHTLQGTPQDEEKATYCHKIEKQAGRIDWSQPAVRIHDQIRAFSPRPGAFTHLGGSYLRVLASRLSPLNSSKPGAVVLVEADRLVVGTGEGSVELRRLQPENRNVMDVEAFLAGRRLKAGDRFE